MDSGAWSNAPNYSRRCRSFRPWQGAFDEIVSLGPTAGSYFDIKVTLGMHRCIGVSEGLIITKCRFD